MACVWAMNGMDVLAHWTGEELYRAWVDAPGSDREAYWRDMNAFNRARWESLANGLNNIDRGAVDLLREVDDGWDRMMESDDLDGMVEVVAKVRAFLAAAGGQ